jgi:hypothetical protein
MKVIGVCPVLIRSVGFAPDSIWDLIWEVMMVKCGGSLLRNRLYSTNIGEIFI